MTFSIKYKRSKIKLYIELVPIKEKGKTRGQFYID
jgi:hypothetical protein